LVAMLSFKAGFFLRVTEARFLVTFLGTEDLR
jgi:hypothetical protein